VAAPCAKRLKPTTLAILTTIKNHTYVYPTISTVNIIHLLFSDAFNQAAKLYEEDRLGDRIKAACALLANFAAVPCYHRIKTPLMLSATLSG
jgi:hypothetical protein